MINEIVDKYLASDYEELTEGMGRKFKPLPAEEEKFNREYFHGQGWEAARRSEKRNPKEGKDFLRGYDDAVKTMKKGIISKYT